MNIRLMHPSDLPACAILAHQAYLAQSSAHGALPNVPPSHFDALLSDLPSRPFSFVAEENGALCGFLGFSAPFNGAFGNCRGVFSPLHANAFSGADPSRTCVDLLTFAMERLYAQGITSIALSHYACDEPVLRTLALTGFGFRCSDLMCRTAPAQAVCEGYSFRTAQSRDLPHLLSLYNALEAHMAASPVFMSKSPWTQERLLPLLDRILVACREDHPVAALLLATGGETFVDNLPCAMHVSSTFCHPDHRGTGVMSALVAFSSDRMHASGIPFLGVDCETLNPPAFRFWQKHFTPFTLSAVRRLDERLLL